MDNAFDLRYSEWRLTGPCASPSVVKFLIELVEQGLPIYLTAGSKTDSIRMNIEDGVLRISRVSHFK